MAVNEYPNAYFRESDPHPQAFGNFDIPPGWWSRAYEYNWAFQFAKHEQVVADMGCGWHYRPFHDALAEICEFTYGVDAHQEVRELPSMKNGAFVVADFSKPILAIAEGSLDRVFCISVLEELICYRDALAEFKRLLKPEGRIILTCDAQYDPDQPPHELYKGVDMGQFEDAMWAVGLRYDGSVNRVKAYPDLLHNDAYNLCVWHCVLEKA